MQKNRKRLIITLVLGVLVCVGGLFSYAYWQLTKKQPSRNDLISACLNFEMKDAVDGVSGLTMQDEWPISDEEGINLEGYHFTVENKCSEAVNYIISLEALKEAKENYLDNQYIKLAIDNEPVMIYGSLEQLDNLSLENDTEVIRDTREIMTATVSGNAKNEHEIKMWISSDAPLEQQGKTFKSRIRITGGQGIENTSTPATADSCFEIDENGLITKYLIEKEECGESVTIPATVNGTQVKSIYSDAFKKVETTYHYNFMLVISSTYEIEKAIVVNPNEEENLRTWGAENGYGQLPFELYESGMTLEEGKSLQLCNIVNNQPDCSVDSSSINEEELFTTTKEVSIKGLDLSQAIYLETIWTYAFSNVESATEPTDSVPYSLTSLTFGNNDKEILIASDAFTKINVDELTVYTSYSATGTPFRNAKINNLTIKASQHNSELTNSLFDEIIANNVNIAEGVTYILDHAINSDYEQFWNAKIGKLTLPSTLTNQSINGRLLFQNFATEYDADRYTGSIDELIINAPITSLSDFKYSKIKTIKLPDTVTEIGDFAFSESSLESINMPNKLQTIGKHAFYKSSLNGELILPASLQTIGNDAFYGTSITAITLKGRTNTDGMRLGSGWNGQAQILFDN